MHSGASPQDGESRPERSPQKTLGYSAVLAAGKGYTKKGDPKTEQPKTFMKVEGDQSWKNPKCILKRNHTGKPDSDLQGIGCGIEG